MQVVHLAAGPVDLEKEKLPAIVEEFTDGDAGTISRRHPVDVLHANYWLSGVVGHRLKHDLDMPLVSTFHTLARVKAADGRRRSRQRRDRGGDPGGAVLGHDHGVVCRRGRASCAPCTTPDPTGWRSFLRGSTTPSSRRGTAAARGGRSRCPIESRAVVRRTDAAAQGSGRGDPGLRPGPRAAWRRPARGRGGTEWRRRRAGARPLPCAARRPPRDRRFGPLG